MLHTRALTVNLQRAVVADGPPIVMEVAVNPLSSPSSPNSNTTLVSGENQDVVMDRTIVPVVFNLVPTDHPDLTQRITYRIAWREKYMGRQFTQDFVMPDFDVDFDDLQDLGNIIGGETYLQWTDRSRPGGVAGLNNQGQVIDADGNVISGSEAANEVQGNLDAEVVARQEGDNFLRTYFLQFAQDQITQLYSSTATNLQAAVAQLQNADTTEKSQRLQAVAALNVALTNLQNATNGQIADLNQLIDEVDTQLTAKADLVGGKVPSSQLPSVALGHAVAVSNQAAMLALTDNDVQPGDFAVRPDGIFFLNASPPSVLGNWIQFQVAATVMSVNGHTGNVVLAAADVNARPVGVNIPMTEVTGLNTALTGKVDVSVTNAINARLTTIENDATIVRTTGGVIPHALHGNDVAFLNNDLQIVTKNGTVVNLGGGGGSLDIADVTGLQAALDGKVSTTDPALTNPRPPTAHASSHATAGSDPITPASIGARATTDPVALGDVSGLSTILGNNGLNASSNVGNRVASLETRVEDLELGGGGGGGGSGASGKTVWFSSVSPIAPLDTSSDDIEIRSPFGFNGTSYYYDPAGVVPTEAVWPYLTPNGHLKFIKRNESAPADAPLATQSALDILTSLVDLKASQSDLDVTNAAVATKASLSALSTLQAAVDGKADESQVSALQTTVTSKANQSDLDDTNAAINAKADQSALDALSTTVAGKANTSTVTTLTGRVSAVETGKADLVGGTVPDAQIPQLAIAKILNLQTSLNAKADLSGGTVPLAQLPSYPTNKVIGLDAALAAKADLVGGVIPTSQLPSLSLTTAVSVASRAAMLALNTTQVQPGDLAVITTTADQGSYILTAADPSVFTNWVKLIAPADAVQSVNGQTGTVVLNAANVGARASGVDIGQNEVTGLVTALGSKADTATVNTQLSGKTSPADVQVLITDTVKQAVDYVSTTNITTLAGQQSADGVLMPVGARVLLTAQSNPVNNGIYTVTSSTGTPWPRVTDMAATTPALRGTLVFVKSGQTNANTIWQMTSASGTVATNSQAWSLIMQAGAPPTFTASNGVQRIGNDFSAKVVSNGGIQATAAGLQRDPTVLPGKFATTFTTTGAGQVTITHNLGTADVICGFRDSASGDSVELGWRPNGVNQVVADFGVAGSWRVVVQG